MHLEIIDCSSSSNIGQEKETAPFPLFACCEGSHKITEPKMDRGRTLTSRGRFHHGKYISNSFLSLAHHGTFHFSRGRSRF